MKRKLFPILAASLALSVFSAGSAFAATSSWTNSSSSTFWKPSSGTFTAYKDPAGYPKIYANLSFQWSTAQKTEMMRLISYYPTVEVRDNSWGGYDGSFMSTNLPDPKYDYEDDSHNGSTDGKDEELEVVSRDQWSISANTNYSLETAWAVVDITSNPQIFAQGSLSNAPSFPGGDYNTVPGLWDNLGSGFQYSQLTTSPFAASQISETATNNATTQEFPAEGKRTNPEYDAIKSKGALTNFKNKSHSAVDKLDDENRSNFIITFNKPIDEKTLQDLIKKYELDATLVYGRGTNSSNETLTYGAKYSATESLEAAAVETSGRTFVGYIQLEGKGNGKTLKKLKEETNVFAVETDSDGNIPMGLYWKLERTK